MEVKKLNCTACGAPISVPDDVDYINCAACGSFLAIQRGEGYVALKVAEKISRVIEDSGRGTQEVIRQGSQDTQMELRRMQLQYELSTADLKLNNIQSEIRAAGANKAAAAQIRPLRMLEYQALDRIRDVRLRFSQLGPQTPEEQDRMLNEQIQISQTMLQVLQMTGMGAAQLQPALTSLQARISEHQQALSQLRAQQITRQLDFYRSELDAPNTLDEMAALLGIISNDLKHLRQMPASPERQEIERQLQEKYAFHHNRWSGLEAARLRGEMQSPSVYRTDINDRAELQSVLEAVQQDIRNLQQLPNNTVAKGYLEKLRGQEQFLIKRIQKIDRQAARATTQASARAVGGFAGIWIVITAFLASIFQKKPKAGLVEEITAVPKLSASTSPADGETPIPLPIGQPRRGTSVINSFLIGGLVGFTVLCVCVGLASVLVPSLLDSEASQTSNSTPAPQGSLQSGDSTTESTTESPLMMPLMTFSYLIGSLMILRLTAPQAGISFLGAKPYESNHPIPLKTFKWIAIILALGLGFMILMSVQFLPQSDSQLMGIGCLLSMLPPIITGLALRKFEYRH